ncbi:hypothetical protein FB451DRAFT_1499432 [Mycena latifolia]|nr:hypothetical protein FB451DRAFT_1499432 [Mycena latifolia]
MDHPHPAFWFEDGDIILSATMGGETWQFLVHKHKLSAHSSVFSRIFNEPSGVQQEDLDGIQAIEDRDTQLLQVGDSVKDLQALLRCLYYPNRMPFKFTEPTVDTDLAGLLRLCRKYDIADLAAKVIDQLKFEWPTSLAVYEQHESRVRMLGIAHASAPQGQSDQKYLDDRLPEPASIISLAREFDIPELLPAAFYSLSFISPVANYDGYHSAARLRPEIAAKLASGARSARWSLLAPGQDQLRSPTLLTKVFEEPKRGQNCRAGCDALLVALRQLAADTHDLLGALTYLRIYISEPDRAPKMQICPSCAASICEIVASLRLRIWRNLPVWFGVPEVNCTP